MHSVDPLLNASKFDEDKLSMANGPAITDSSNSVAARTKAEFDALVAKFNALLSICRDAGLVALDQKMDQNCGAN
jgi:hypothetical protein